MTEGGRPRKRRWLRRLVVAAVVLVALIVVSVALAAHYTESNNFCISNCHEMRVYGDTWHASTHKNVRCVRCHIEPGAFSFVKAKIYALREVWVHFTKKDIAPIYVTRHIDNETCVEAGCHSRSRLHVAVNLPSTAFRHDQHGKLRCIDCHARVTHRSVAGHAYIAPRTMAACFACHDGQRQSNACATCHTPPHPDRGVCNGCHNLSSWASKIGHPVALGKHARVVCERCHLHDYTGLPKGCVSCHKARHGARYRLCAKCHLPTRFVPSTYDHPKTNCAKCHTRTHPDRGLCVRCHQPPTWASHFAHPVTLGAVHGQFTCERCHRNGVAAAPIACVTCHGARHGAQYARCAQCHSMVRFVPSTFNHPTTNCVRCHTPPHPYRGPCERCHRPPNWIPHFAHPIALGAHSGFACERCHTGGVGSAPRLCVTCHGDHHGGLPNCRSCHTMSYFIPSTFRHPQEGPHVPAGDHPLACSACHSGGYAHASCPCHGGNPPGGGG